MNKQFEVNILLTGSTVSQSLKIQHNDETFQFELGGTEASILNNGDNSWSLVSGVLKQEVVNEIGQAIEAYYRAQPL